tara:strand:- start:291 stop:509 length:219 start_codon:yes stop_codon:yes gene_type:complete
MLSLQKSIVIVLFICSYLNACAVCYGSPDDIITIGMRMAILTLLGFIVSVLIGIIFVIRHFMKQSKLNELKG